jgi:excisionase family DNA binding protein
MGVEEYAERLVLKIIGEQYLTRKQAANMIGVHVRTVDNWIKKKGLPHFKIDGTVRISPKAYHEWINKNVSSLPSTPESPEDSHGKPLIEVFTRKKCPTRTGKSSRSLSR